MDVPGDSPKEDAKSSASKFVVWSHLPVREDTSISGTLESWWKLYLGYEKPVGFVLFLV